MLLDYGPSEVRHDPVASRSNTGVRPFSGQTLSISRRPGFAQKASSPYVRQLSRSSSVSTSTRAARPRCRTNRRCMSRETLRIRVRRLRGIGSRTARPNRSRQYQPEPRPFPPLPSPVRPRSPSVRGSCEVEVANGGEAARPSPADSALQGGIGEQWRPTTNAALALQAGGRRFDPGTLHRKRPWKQGLSRFLFRRR